eukprot:UN11156
MLDKYVNRLVIMMGYAKFNRYKIYRINQNRDIFDFEYEEDYKLNYFQGFGFTGRYIGVYDVYMT